MIVIGLSAKMGCGKTTLARLLLERAEVAGIDLYERIAFGDLLKQECAEYFDFPLAWACDQERKGWKVNLPEGAAFFHGLPATMTVRELLQWYGTDYRRAQDPLYWVSVMRKRLAELAGAVADRQALVVIDDVRFPDEALLVLEHGRCYRLEPFPGWQPGPNAAHASETALDDFTGFTCIFRPGYGQLGSVADAIAASSGLVEGE